MVFYNKYYVKRTQLQNNATIMIDMISGFVLLIRAVPDILTYRQNYS